MLNLAIECSGTAGSVALCHGRDLVAKRQLPPAVGSVQSLAPVIDSLLTDFCPTSHRRVELISVTHGPGSFTGLRVGLATAQMLAFAWKIPLAPVDTLAAIAYAVCSAHLSEKSCLVVETGKADSTLIVPVLNAFRKQVFVAAWRVGSSNNQLPSTGLPVFKPVAKSQVLDALTWQAQPWRSLVGLEPSELESANLDSVLVCGPGLRTYAPNPHGSLSLADPKSWEPDALAVAQLGWNIHLAGETVSAHELRPNYVRASAAEECN